MTGVNCNRQQSVTAATARLNVMLYLFNNTTVMLTSRQRVFDVPRCHPLFNTKLFCNLEDLFNGTIHLIIPDPCTQQISHFVIIKSGTRGCSNML